MNLNNLTLKSQEAFAQAQLIAHSHKQARLETLHILKALIEIDANVIPFLLKKLDTNPKIILQIVDKQIQSLAKGNGSDIYMSPTVNTVIQKAILFSNELHDDFVSLEHLFYGVFMANDETSKILKDAGISEKGIKTAIENLRKGSKVTGETAKNLTIR